MTLYVIKILKKPNLTTIKKIINKKIFFEYYGFLRIYVRLQEIILDTVRVNNILVL